MARRCSICRESGHYKRSCPNRCFGCGEAWIDGHACAPIQPVQTAHTIIEPPDTFDEIADDSERVRAYMIAELDRMNVAIDELVGHRDWLALRIARSKGFN